MRPIFSAAEMRACDTAATAQYGLPGIVLMENAARGAVDVAEKHFGALRGAQVLVLAGGGNNGGDGFAMARHLHNRGATVDVLTLADDDGTAGDARTNLHALRALERETSALRVQRMDGARGVRAQLAARPSLVVDALLGTGLEKALRSDLRDIVGAVNTAGCPVLAVDMPTGIHADSGAVMGAAIRAQATATMGGLKRGLLLGEGREHAGAVHVVDIGMPDASTMRAATDTFLLESEDIRGWMPRRRFDAHKYRMGSVLVVAGSLGMTGAAALTSEGALRSGAGMVRLAIPRSLNPILEMKLTEVITIPCDETAELTLGLHDYDALLARINASEASVLGPGVSRQFETQQLMRRLLRHATAPLLLDADAIVALAGHADLLQLAESDLILTPHLGEFSRLAERDSAEIEAVRIEYARTFAAEHGVTLLLKGAPTVIASRDGRVAVNPTGNPGMATAGTGDVLSGLVAGLRAQGMESFHAACAGAYLHGLAGDHARGRMAGDGLIATDVLAALGGVMRDLHAGTL